MTDVPAFYEATLAEFRKLKGRAEETLVGGNFPDWAAYKHEQGYHKGLMAAEKSLQSLWQSLLQGRTGPKESNGGRKSEIPPGGVY